MNYKQEKKEFERRFTFGKEASVVILRDDIKPIDIWNRITQVFAKRVEKRAFKKGFEQGKVWQMTDELERKVKDT